jgi:uncharacterized Zn-binding protein involved in type VI secretion
MRPIAVLGMSMCACGAVFTFTPQATVFSTGMLVVVTGGMQSHGGVITPIPTGVFAEGLPVAGVGDIVPICPWVYPHHFAQPIVSGDVFTTIP